MFVMLNKDGKKLPLTMPLEDDAKKMIGVDPETIRESIPAYGIGFEGDGELCIRKFKIFIKKFKKIEKRHSNNYGIKIPLISYINYFR